MAVLRPVNLDVALPDPTLSLYTRGGTQVQARRNALPTALFCGLCMPTRGQGHG
jgi:hypothetical protein